jgi:hypothetical protein
MRVYRRMSLVKRALREYEEGQLALKREIYGADCERCFVCCLRHLHCVSADDPKLSEDENRALARKLMDARQVRAINADTRRKSVHAVRRMVWRVQSKYWRKRREPTKSSAPGNGARCVDSTLFFSSDDICFDR